MRKIFANLKSVVALAVVAAMTLSVSCMYDDTALTKRVSKVEKDLAALTEKVNGLAGQEVTLENLLAGNLVITGVTTDAAGNTVVSLSNGESFTVLAEAETLQYRTENGVLEISADGETWVAVTADAACLVKEVRTNADGTITIVFANGTEFTGTVAELIECEATRSAVYAVSGITKAVRFTINDAVEDINVMNQPFGWSATVEEYVAPEEPGLDDGFGVLAVGGKEYVLNINAPSAELVRSGYAAKEGVVSVHFNTAAGTCKVMKVSVTLAELTLAVENGNITLTNTVAFEQTNYFGEKFTDFADFWIGFMPKEAYETYLEGNISIEEALYEAVYSQRSSGFSTAMDGVQQYVEGECEKETYTFTLDQFYQGAFYGDPLPYGVDYVVFVTTENTKTFEPDLSKAVTVDYVKSIVSARIVEGTETWNDVTLELSLAGYDNYSFVWISDAEVNEYLSYGYFGSTVEEFLPMYLGDNYTFAYGGSWLANLEPVIEQYAELSTIASLTAGYDIPRINAGTLYHLVVYPFNGTEEDLYNHEFDASKMVYCGTFETAPLVAGTFEAGATFETNELTAKKIDVTVTFENTDIATVAYTWFDEPFMDPEQALAAIMSDNYTEYVTLNEEVRSINATKSSYWNLPETIYLGMVVITANGEYLYIQQWFGKDPNAIDYEVEYTKADFADGVLTLKGETNKDAISIAVNPGLETLVAGDYVTAAEDWSTGVCQVQWSSADAKEIFANATSFDYTGNPNSYPYYVTADFKMNVAVEGDVYTIVATDKISGLGNVKFSFTGTLGIEEEETATVVFTSATAALSEGQTNWHDITFANGTDTAVIRIATYGTTKCLFGKYAQRNYGQDCCINDYTTTNTWNGVNLWPVAMDVVDNGDGTLSVTIEATEYGGNGDSHVGTFTGVIEGLTFEHPEAAPEFTIPGDGVNYELELRYTKLVDGLDAANAVRVADENGYNWDIKFNSGLSSIEPGDYKAVNAFTTADALEVDTYNGGLGYGYSQYMYVEAYDDTTINVQKNGDWYCITLICTNGAGCFDCPVTGAFRAVYIGKLVK